MWDLVPDVGVIPRRIAQLGGDTGFGEIFLVKEGDSVTLRYRVAKISSEAVELTDLTDNTPLRLALR